MPHKKPSKEKSETQKAELKFQGFITKRDEYNEKGRQARDERDSLNKQRSKMTADILKLRDQMRENVSQKKKFIQKKTASQDKAKQLIALKQSRNKDKSNEKTSPRDTVQHLMNEIINLENRLETTEMEISKERVLVEKISILRRSLGEAQITLTKEETLYAEISEIDEKIDAEFKQADKHHKEIIKLAKENQKLYNSMKDLITEATHLSTEADKKHHEFLKIRQKADHQHKRAVEMRQKLKGKRHEAFLERKKARKVLKDHSKEIENKLHNQKKLDKIAEETLGMLLTGGKIDL
tara:strand:- start:1014 stop:1898 length:885 start_codon:yes stop_codon:yes gene_type:complete